MIKKQKKHLVQTASIQKRENDRKQREKVCKDPDPFNEADQMT